MAFEDIQFPVYRKYKNGKSYFKIISGNEFEEIQRLGSKITINTIKAVQFPEMNHIYDLVYDKKIADEIQSEEYDSVKSNS